MIALYKSPYPFIKKYEIILQENNIPFQWVDISEPDFWDKIYKTRLFIYHMNMGAAQHLRQLSLIHTINGSLGIQCIPDVRMAWFYDNKVAMTLLLQAKGYPFAQSWLFWDRKSALQWAADYRDYPVVFKLKNGAASINVVKAVNYQQAKLLINSMFGKGIVNNRLPGSNRLGALNNNLKLYVKNEIKYYLDRLNLFNTGRANYERQNGYALFQQFLPCNAYDTRVTVIDDKAFAFRRYVRRNDFRASGSGMIDYDIHSIDPDMLRIAMSISKEMKYNTMTYDFIYDGAKPVIVEMNCQFVDVAVYNCKGYWDDNIKWNEGHYWPQLLQLQSCLPSVKLKQPEIMET